MSTYMKAIVAVIQAVLVGVQTYYPGAKWEPIVTAVVGAALVYLVPNSSNTGIQKANTESPKSGGQNDG